MATKIKPQKLISTSITSSESGGLKFPSSVNKSVYSITTSFNQIGKTLEGIGKTTESIRDIVVARGTWLENQLNETINNSEFIFFNFFTTSYLRGGMVLFCFGFRPFNMAFLA